MWNPDVQIPEYESNSNVFLESVHNQLGGTYRRSQVELFASARSSDVKLRSIGVETPGCEVVAVDANTGGRSTLKDGHVEFIDVSRSESLFVAAELTQIHDVEATDFDTLRDDVFNIIDIMLLAFASEHALVNTCVETPNADAYYRWSRCPRHCEQVLLLALDLEALGYESVGA